MDAASFMVAGQQQAAASTGSRHGDFASATAAAAASHEQKQSAQQVPQQATEPAQSAGTPQVGLEVQEHECALPCNIISLCHPLACYRA